MPSASSVAATRATSSARWRRTPGTPSTGEPRVARDERPALRQRQARCSSARRRAGGPGHCGRIARRRRRGVADLSGVLSSAARAVVAVRAGASSRVVRVRRATRCRFSSRSKDARSRRPSRPLTGTGGRRRASLAVDRPASGPVVGEVHRRRRRARTAAARVPIVAHVPRSGRSVACGRPMGRLTARSVLRALAGQGPPADAARARVDGSIRLPERSAAEDRSSTDADRGAPTQCGAAEHRSRWTSRARIHGLDRVSERRACGHRATALTRYTPAS